MLEETKDEVQQDNQTPSDPIGGPKVIKKESSQASEQSETTKVEPESSKAYKVDFPDGTFKEMTPDQLYEHYQKIGPEFNKRSQELAELKRREQEMEARNRATAEEAMSNNKLLEGVDPAVREAIVQIVSPVIQEALQAKDLEAQKKQTQVEFDRRLNDLEKKYVGGEGLPKFDRLGVLKAMQDPKNEVYDPELKFLQLNWDAYMDYKIKQAIKGKSGSTITETTGTEPPRKPGGEKAPSTWAEAASAAYQRLTNS